MNDDITMIAPAGVLKFTKERVPPRKVLVGALEAGLTEVLVLGIDEDGDHYAACSTGADELIRKMWDQFQARLTRGAYIGNPSEDAA